MLLYWVTPNTKPWSSRRSFRSRWKWRWEVRRSQCFWWHSWAGQFYTAQGKRHLSLYKSSFCSSYNYYKPLSFQAREAISASAHMRNLCSDPQTELRNTTSNATQMLQPWVLQWRCCRHSCAIQAGQGVMQVSKILRAVNCLVTILFTVQVAFD